MRLVQDLGECSHAIGNLLEATDPIFIGRLGGSDTEAVAALLEAQETTTNVWSSIYKHRTITERLNGFYDKSRSGDLFIRYLNELQESYTTLRNAFFCTKRLNAIYFPEFAPEPIVDFRAGLELLVNKVDGIGGGLVAYPYAFVERLSRANCIMQTLSRFVAGKKLLIVSPFEESIKFNSNRIDEIFKSFSFPKTEVLIQRTPITYAGLPAEFYPHNNWFETVDWLKDRISHLDFDLALLSCGSYAMPIGCFIEKSLQRKAIYIGGVLQLMFGILGRRYADNTFFTDMLNLDRCIFPIEGNDYLKHVRLSPEMAREAFAAYF